METRITAKLRFRPPQYTADGYRPIEDYGLFGDAAGAALVGRDLGLLPEQIDPADGTFLGNFPQAFNHVRVIASGRNLAQALQGTHA